jgi:hypothetical protein
MEEYVSNGDEPEGRFKDRNCRYRNGSQQPSDSAMTLLLNQIIELQREHGRDLKNLSEKVVGWDNFKRFRDELIGRQEGLEDRQKTLENKVDDLNEICVQFETLKPSLVDNSTLKDAKNDAIKEANENAKSSDESIIKDIAEIKTSIKQIESWTQILSFTMPALMKNKVALGLLISGLVSLLTTLALVTYGRVYDFGVHETIMIMLTVWGSLIALVLLIVVIRAKGDPNKMKSIFLAKILIIIMFMLLVPCYAEQSEDIPLLDDGEVVVASDPMPLIPIDGLLAVAAAVKQEVVPRTVGMLPSTSLGDIVDLSTLSYNYMPLDDLIANDSLAFPDNFTLLIA